MKEPDKIVLIKKNLRMNQYILRKQKIKIVRYLLLYHQIKTIFILRKIIYQLLINHVSQFQNRIIIFLI